MVTSSISRIVCFFLLSASLLACGGAGGVGANGPSVSLSASKLSIAYGQPVTISWSSKKISSIESSNFRVGSASVDGSITDTPGSTTTYSITGYGEDGNRYTGSVTVSVAKGSKSILVVGDVAQSGVNQIIEQIQAVSSATVQVLATVPATISSDVVVLLSDSNVTSSDVNKIKSQLSRGGGVVLVGNSSRLLATGSASNTDVSPIGSFCAGVTECVGDDLNSSSLLISPVSFPYGATVLDREVRGYSMSPISATATPLTQVSPWQSGGYSGFLYSPSTGGRVAYAGSAPADNSESSAAMRAIFLSEVRWASGE
ncbi:MAG: hypothetical protein WCK51_01495 [Armatimonadota bacterium]